MLFFVRIETILMIMLALLPLVAIPQPAPRSFPQLPASRPIIAGLLPARILSRTEKRIAELDAELRNTFVTACQQRQAAFTPKPLFT